MNKKYRTLFIITNSTFKFKPIAYYLSQYFWILYIVIPLLLSIIIPAKSRKATILSSNSKFNNSKDPIIFAHISDTHINTLRPSSIDAFRKLVRNVKLYSPEFIIHAGDIVDNYDSLSFPRYGDQSESNWKAYREETEIINNIPIIEVGGNHDMFGIKSATSHRNYIIDSNHTMNRQTVKNDENFYVNSFRLGPSKTNVITVNPFNFPTPHAPLMMVMTFSKKLLNLLEKEIEKSDTKSIVVSHFPVASTHSRKSSTGKKFHEIVDSNEKVLAFLCGHWHPRKPTVSYLKKGTIQIIGTVGYRESRFGIVTIDNDAMSWTLVDDTKSPPVAVISYPIPMGQISSQSIFNDKENTEIRVVVFSDQTNLSISFTVVKLSDSKTVFKGYLKFSRHLINGRSLYTYPMKEIIHENGKYRITFSEYFDGLIEFLIGESAEVTVDNYGRKYMRLQETVIYIFPFYFLLLFVITFLIPFNCFNCQTKLDLIEEWIETSNSNTSYWIFSTFAGFLLVRSRFLKSPKIIQIFVFISVILSVAGPINIFQTEDSYGFIWTYGYVIDNKILPSDYGVIYAFYYLTFTCLPMILLSSSFGVKNWSLFQISDFIAALGCVVGDVYILIRVVHESVGPKLTAASPGFVIFPLIFVILFTVFIAFERVKNKLCKKNDNENENNSITQNLNTLPSQDL